MCGNSSGTPEPKAEVWVVWLVWSAALVWLVARADAISAWTTPWGVYAPASVAGVLTVPLLNPPRVAGLLLLAPVWLFGAWFTLSSMFLPSGYFLSPFFAYMGGWMATAIGMLVWQRLQARRSGT
ncbi:MAG: hypothetical protein WHS44_11700 [Fimbriimonadales bacterium]|nr:MAG: hypothetical protein KatS3mg018_2402 [Fimbriimonadales bacterium]